MSFPNNFFLTKNIKKDISIILILVILPFTFFLYKIAPKTRVWSNNFFTVDFGNYYNAADFFIWFILLKIMTLILLSVWFLTCKNNWRFVLFIPISAEIYKLYTIIKILEFDHMYTPRVLDTILFSIPYLIVLLLISKSIGYYNYSRSDFHVVNDEINSQMNRLSKFNFKDYKSVKKELMILINKKENMPKREYLAQLIALRDRISV